MNELSERARELAEKLAKDDIAYEPFLPCTRVTAIASLIEQALLAERRLAMEEAIAIADNEGLSEEVGPGDEAYNTAIIHVCKALRAAAEKEVGTK